MMMVPMPKLHPSLVETLMVFVINSASMDADLLDDYFVVMVGYYIIHCMSYNCMISIGC
jgi:hypothetical protein